MKELCKSFCDNPICKDHPETDIEWRILSFLLNTSRNPIDGVVKNRQKIKLHTVKEDVDVVESDDGEEDFRGSFVEQEFSDSELSVNLLRYISKNNLQNILQQVWSDDDEDAEEEQPQNVTDTQNIDIVAEYEEKLSAMFPGLKRPQKPSHYTLMDTSKSSLTSFLFSKVQHHWWNDASYVYPSVSDFPTANYCHFW